MDTVLYLGRLYDWEDTSNPAISINNQSDVQSIVIKEFVGQTTPSFVIKDSTGAVTFSILNGVVVTAASPVTSTVAQTITVNSLTTGTGLVIQSSATAITTTGRMFVVTHSGATSTSGILSEFLSAANDETVIVQIKGSDVLALGKALNIDVAAMTTGQAIVITPTALTTGKAISVTDLAALTTGIGLNITSAATAIATTGRMVFVNHTGATGTSAVLSEFKSAANDETVIFRITATDVLALGKALDLQIGSATTGSGIVITPTALTTGKAISITDLAALTSGIGLNITSAATAITGAGRLLFVSHTGASGTSATLAEIASAAADETIIFQVTASAALAAGKAVFVSCAAMTTGIAVDISGSTATTSGTLLNINDNSADTTARSVVKIKQDHASATGATPLEILNDNGTLALIKGTATVVSTHFYRFATVNGVTLWVGDGTTANSALSGTAGDVLLNGGSGKPEYCTGTTSWTALV